MRRLAKELEAEAARHRRLADELEHALTVKPTPVRRPQYLVQLDRAAEELVELPAAEIRAAAGDVAKRHGVAVLPLSIVATRKRRERRVEARRKAALLVMAALAHGDTLKAAGEAAGVSEATAWRLRQEWLEGQFGAFPADPP